MSLFSRLRPGEAVTPQRFNALVDAVNTYANAGEGAAIQVAHPPGFYGQITANNGDPSSTNQWIYSWKMMEKTGAGYGGWAAVSISSANVTGSANAYNRIEDVNTGSSVEGNGVNFSGSDFPASFAMQPVPNSAIVYLQPVSPWSASSSQAIQEYWFGYENGIDGSCA